MALPLPSFSAPWGGPSQHRGLLPRRTRQNARAGSSPAPSSRAAPPVTPPDPLPSHQEPAPARAGRDKVGEHRGARHRGDVWGQTPPREHTWARSQRGGGLHWGGGDSANVSKVRALPRECSNLYIYMSIYIYLCIHAQPSARARTAGTHRLAPGRARLRPAAAPKNSFRPNPLKKKKYRSSVP